MEKEITGSPEQVYDMFGQKTENSKCLFCFKEVAKQPDSERVEDISGHLSARHPFLNDCCKRSLVCWVTALWLKAGQELFPRFATETRTLQVSIPHNICANI